MTDITKLAANRSVMPAVIYEGEKPMREQLRHFRLGLIGAMSVACVLATTTAANAVDLTAPVATTTGTYQGLKNFQELPGDPTSGVNLFLGIRYAQPPVGALRWKPPLAPNPGQGSIVAASVGHTCTQVPPGIPATIDP
jgi:para-nitrobenzyl esterase